ncbi:MAG: FtsX-like permease family protein, partial [Treponema sp.]|nr:FtsX-like permease family protein [Treponema sp.]
KNPENAIVKQLTGKEFKWDGVKYAVEGLDDGVPQLKTVMMYVNMISTIILIVILLITMVGISNTYRMVLYERIREIGTMRALGMTRKDTKRSFRMEAVILSLASGIVGLILSIILMLVLGLNHIEAESVQMFLKAGHMTFSLSPFSIIFQYVLMVLLTMLAVNGTAKRAARMSPAQALRTVK